VKRVSQLISVTLIFVFIFSGCSIEKRRYTHGYNIQWNSAKSEAKKNEITRSRKQSEAEKISSDNSEASVNISSDEPVTASADNGKVIAYEVSKKNHHRARIQPDDCDVITLKDGNEIRVKVTEITEDEVKYKKCDKPDGEILTLKKSTVLVIKYANGTKDILNKDLTNASKILRDEKKDVGLFGILSFVSIVIAIFLIVYSEPLTIVSELAVIILTLASIVFGIIGGQFGRKFRGFVLAGLILGSVIGFTILILELSNHH
jgi:hypothetical protein